MEVMFFFLTDQSADPFTGDYCEIIYFDFVSKPRDPNKISIL